MHVFFSTGEPSLLNMALETFNFHGVYAHLSLKVVIWLDVYSESITLRSVFEGSGTECKCFFDGGTAGKP